MEEKNLIQWIKEFDEGKFDNPDRSTQIEAGWYDWFCKDTSLVKKTVSLGSKLKSIIKSPKLDPANQYVLFKNNCPVRGELYDDFRICDILTGDVIFTIVPKSGHEVHGGKGNVWGRENNFKDPLFEGSWKEIKNWFLK